MRGVCQVIHGILAISTAIGTAGAGPTPLPTPVVGHVSPVSIEVRPYAPKEFSALLLDEPQVAAAWALAPSWRSQAGVPKRLPSVSALARALGAAFGPPLAEPPGTLVVVVAGADVRAPAALPFGQTIIVLVPQTEPWADDDVARVVATAVLFAGLRPARPDPRCSEPLLTFAESLADAGSLGLASLPAELRPVSEWLEPKDALPALELLANSALDGTQPWQTRRAGMTRLAHPAGANPAIAQAAALVVEAFGDAMRARRTPFDMLLAWRSARRKSNFPPMPRSLRRALGDPHEAGMPEGKENRADVAAVALDALERAIETGHPPARPDPTATLAQRMLVVAKNRGAANSSGCTWLQGVTVPRGLRTGCRNEGETGGVVYTRPLPSGTCEIVARSPDGDEGVLLPWPRLALFATVEPNSSVLAFVDREGVWEVDLDGGAAPRLSVPGRFRFLSPSPDGEALATVRWPTGFVTVRTSEGTRDTAVSGKGGVAWIEPDVVMASDGDKLALVNTSGRSRPWLHALPCCRSLTAIPGAVLAGTAAPCESGIARVSLADGSAARLLGLGGAPLGVVPQPGGALEFGVNGELWLWKGAPAAERIGAGLTPGPS
jgi:hypothetical protein